MHQVENFEDVASKKLAVVEFFTQWCGPCKAQKRVLQDIEKGKMDLFFASIDVETNPEISDKFHIGSVPTTIIFENGKEKGRLNGFQRVEKIENLIDSAVAV